METFGELVDSFVNTDPEIVEYLQTLDEDEQNVTMIAYDHLKSSFSIKKSVGFNKWKQNNK
jgi:hypothetical protein